jgi:hypothetical protein
MPADLDRLIAIFAAALAPLAAASGCGIDESQFAYDACTEARDYTILGAVTPASPADYLELRRWEDYFGGESPASPTILEAKGTLCAGASDTQACTDAFAALALESELATYGGEIVRYGAVAYTRGDEVGSAGTRADLDALLGPIDAPGDAALLALLTGNQLHCNAGNEVGDHAEGYVVYTRSGSGCGEGDDVEHHVLLVRADGTTEVIETRLVERADPNCAIGRLPGGLCRRPAARAPSPIAAFLADVAELEAAAVPAFAQLARELVCHRSPRSLVRGALRGRDDEVRHARLMTGLARRRGARPQPPRVLPTAPRRLEAVAEDNAVEGCVRETYGALVAQLQARRARDPELRRAFQAIARDEARHAALSWQLHRWMGARLGPAARRRVALRRAQAVERLRHELTGALDPQVHALAGMPAPAEARGLFDRLEADFRRSA